MKLSAVQPFTVLDYPGKVACIAFTPGCNMRCGFCHNPEFVLPENVAKLQKSFIDEETFFRFLRRRAGLLEGVVVSGGEPTIWQDLPEFLGRIRAAGFLVKLDTNGNHPEMLERLIGEGLVDYVAMDLKTSLSRYSSLVGPSAKAERIGRSVACLKSTSLPYEFRTTLIKEVHTPAVLTEMAEVLAGAERLFLQRFRPGHTLHPRFARYHPFSSEETEGIGRMFQRSVAQVGIRA